MPKFGILLRALPVLAFCVAGSLSVSSAIAAPGDLDPAFGRGGEFVFQANSACIPGCVEFFGSYAGALLVQHDGKVVLGGRNILFGGSRSDVPTTALVRANANGTPDSSFGLAGLAAGPPFDIWHIYETESRHLLVVGGSGYAVGVEDLSETGVPDEAFGPFGVSPTRSFPSQLPVYDAQIDRRGRIVVVAGAPSVYGGPAGPIEVMRFLPQGAPDRGFGSNGRVVLHGLSVTGSVRPLAFALKSDGSVLLLGQNYNAGKAAPRTAPFLVRLTANGKLASSFGRHGIVPMPAARWYTSPVLAADPHGRILLAASTVKGESAAHEPPLQRTGQDQLLLMRFTADGRLDRSFGRRGVASETPFANEQTKLNSSVVPAAIVIDTNGDPLVAGSH